MTPEERAEKLTPLGGLIPSTPEALQVFRAEIASQIRDAQKEEAEIELGIIADLVAQNCYEEDGVYESGCIGAHADAIRFLCAKGHMKMVCDGIGRNCSARFKLDGPITGFIGHNPKLVEGETE